METLAKMLLTNDADVDVLLKEILENYPYLNETQVNNLFEIFRNKLKLMAEENPQETINMINELLSCNLKKFNDIQIYTMDETKIKEAFDEAIKVFTNFLVDDSGSYESCNIFYNLRRHFNEKKMKDRLSNYGSMPYDYSNELLQKITMNINKSLSWIFNSEMAEENSLEIINMIYGLILNKY
jgi:hypothetical protein